MEKLHKIGRNVFNLYLRNLMPSLIIATQKNTILIQNDVKRRIT